LSVVLALSQTIKTRIDSYKWQFVGNYVLGDILADLCARSGCSLGLSGEVVDLPITLSVRTNSPQVLLSSIRSSLAASGYYLSGTITGQITVSKDLAPEMAAFVDCRNQVQLVPKLQLWAYKKADSLNCIAPEITVSRRWRFEFMSVSKTVFDSYGFQVSHPLAYGEFSVTNFTQKQHLADSWNLDYLAENDSLFEYRAVSFDLDSSSVFSWGTQKQVMSRTIINNGIQTHDYEWRQYGVDVQISSFPKLVMTYTLRSPDESTISGKTALGSDSTAFVVAHYDYNSRGESCFLPFLPIFCKPSYTQENRYFVLRLYPLPEMSVLGRSGTE